MFTKKTPTNLNKFSINIMEHKTQPQFMGKGIGSVGKGTAIPNRPVCYKTSMPRDGVFKM